jgi:hypothetical protein
VLDDLISREPPAPRIADPPPDDAHIRGAKLRLAVAAIRPYLCTINVPLHDKHVFDTHVLAAAGTAKTGRDQGRSRGAEKTAIIARSSGREISVFPGPALPLGAIQQWMQMHFG